MCGRNLSKSVVNTFEMCGIRIRGLKLRIRMRHVSNELSPTFALSDPVMSHVNCTLFSKLPVVLYLP